MVGVYWKHKGVQYHEHEPHTAEAEAEAETARGLFLEGWTNAA